VIAVIDVMPGDQKWMREAADLFEHLADMSNAVSQYSDAKMFLMGMPGQMAKPKP
jgi:hypothetical protein